MQDRHTADLEPGTASTGSGRLGNGVKAIEKMFHCTALDAQHPCVPLRLDLVKALMPNGIHS